MSKPVIVIYHASCQDGFTAAWCLHLAFPEAEFVPAFHGDPPPDVRGKRVFVVDFSYKRGAMLDLIVAADGDVTLLDHHESAVKELAGLAIDVENTDLAYQTAITLDMSHSGGMLAWLWLVENDRVPDWLRGAGVPWIVRYTEDRDLWRFALEDSKAYNAWLGTLPKTFPMWSANAMFYDSPAHKHDAYLIGRTLLNHETAERDRIVKFAVEIELAGYKVLAVNTGQLISEVAEVLARGRPFGCCYFDKGDGRRVWSLRSREGGINVADVARRFGGGGHPGAAGFTVPCPLVVPVPPEAANG